jgi:hypothetical protein
MIETWFWSGARGGREKVLQLMVVLGSQSLGFFFGLLTLYYAAKK